LSTQNDLLRKIDFFEPLDQKIITKISQVCIEREYSKGEYIVKQGESGLGLFFITSGRVKVEVERNEIKSVVATLQSEDFLGELSIIDNKPRSANVICLEDTRCLLLTRDSFSKLINKYPEIAIQMAKALAGRIRAANEKMSQPLPGSVVTPGGEVPAAIAQPAAPPSPTGPSAGSEARGKASNNGASSEASAKNKVKDFIVDTFDFLYTVKALTRFSAAVVGCPVTIDAGSPGPNAAQAVIGGVKVALFPATSDRVIRIDAYDEGGFTAAVFQPAICKTPARFFRCDSHVAKKDRLYLHIPHSGGPWIERESQRTETRREPLDATGSNTI
jgi:hypothetical protein